MTSGWAISADAASSSFMLYDRVYPPTITSFVSPSVSASARPTRSLVLAYSYDICANSGGSVTLPIIGSYVDITTNTGSTYLDNANCAFTIRGDSSAQFAVAFSVFSTEDCCDKFSVTRGGSILFNAGGTTLPTTFLVPFTNILNVGFISDQSVVLSGVKVRITLVSGPTPTMTGSLSRSAFPSISARVSTSNSKSASLSNSALSSRSITESGKPSFSPSADFLPQLSSSTRASFSPSSSSSASSSSCQSTSSSFSVSIRPTISSILSHTQVSSRSIKVSATFNNSGSSSYSLSKTSSSSSTSTRTTSASYVYRPKIMVAPGLPTNLESMSSSEIAGAITELGNYDPSLIKKNLQILGAAALFKMDGPLVLATDTFSLTMAKLDNNSAPVGVGPIAISVPVLNVTGAAASSVIQWTSNPYPNSSIDSSVISMSIIDTSGSSVLIRNLSIPIVMNWKLDIDADDARFQEPPQYIARCDTGIIYKGIGNNYQIFSRGGNKWLVPCLLGSTAWVNCSKNDVIVNFACPAATITHRCLYWSAAGYWSEEGCTAVGGANNSITCLCTHLTDFSARVDAVVTQNAAIFNNAKNVYSEEGLIRYAQWYGIFGGIALVTFLLGFMVVRIDQVAIEEYVKSLCKNDFVSDILWSSSTTPIYLYDAFSTIREVDRHSKATVVHELNFVQRILIQHSRLGFLFRFDPRLSRLFRLLSIFLLQFHSLFVTALFYGFTYGASGKSNMMWYDTILLAIITTALNMPVVKGLIGFMNTVGLEEFKNSFPILYSEYHRRIAFEKPALVYIEKKLGLKLNDNDKVKSQTNNEDFDTAMHDTGGDDENSVLNFLYVYCCFGKKNALKEEEKDLASLTTKQLAKKMATVVKESYPYIEAYANIWGTLPCHTRLGFLFLCCSFGWIGFCLNYLLLFAAAHDKSVGESVMTSYATSEITTVFLTQPVIISASYIFYKLLNKYKDRLPEWIKKRVITNFIKTIPTAYYFSDPWVGIAKTSFSSEYAYNIFVRAPAVSLGVSEAVYANQKAIVYGEHSEDHETIVELKSLYRKAVDTWAEIMHKVR